MKITLDTNTIQQLNETYGEKAPQALWTALMAAQAKIDRDLCFDGVTNPLDYEEIVRQQKISQRLSVAIMENARDVLTHLNRTAEKGFKFIPGNLKPIALLIRSYDKETVMRVVDIKVAEWKGCERMDKHLNPGTIFRPSNFEKYANQLPPIEVQENNFAKELDSILGVK